MVYVFAAINHHNRPLWKHFIPVLDIAQASGSTTKGKEGLLIFPGGGGGLPLIVNCTGSLHLKGVPRGNSQVGV